jgi:hypothetical protein
MMILLIDAIHGSRCDESARMIPTHLDISAVDVLDHMRSQASCINGQPGAQTPLASMIFMMQQAETNADADCYMSAIGLLVNIFAASLGPELSDQRVLCDWHCMSDVELVFKSRFSFLKTKNRSNVA